MFFTLPSSRNKAKEAHQKIPLKDRKIVPIKPCIACQKKAQQKKKGK